MKINLQPVVLFGRLNRHIPDAAEVFFHKGLFAAHNRRFVFGNSDISPVFFRQLYDFLHLAVVIEFNGDDIAVQFFRFKKAMRSMVEFI